MLDFTDKVVAVTGSGGGIGKAIALLFAERGAAVAVNSVRAETGAETCRAIAEDLGGRCLFVRGDASDDATARKIALQAESAFGGLDILVNNVGVTLCGGVEEMSEEDLDRLMRVNIKSAFLVSKHAIPLIRKRGGGCIVNLSSNIAFKGQAQRAAYAATKGAILSMTRCMAVDLLQDRIRVNCICPGATYTEKMEDRFLFEGKGDREKGVAYYNRMSPLGRMADTREIASAVLYAASDEASYMDGSAIVIDGGRIM